MQQLKPIHVFLVEDQEIAPIGLETMLDRTPEGDLKYVGYQDKNVPDLANHIKKSQADVVLVDLVLCEGGPDTHVRQNPMLWGIAAIEAIRNSCHPELKIIAYSTWPNYRNEALEAGADSFLSKATPPDLIRQTIHYLMGRTPIAPEDPHNLGRITTLELFPKRKEFILRGNRSTTPLRLDSAPFALLHYLALERQSKELNWVERLEDTSNIQVAQYHMNKPELWRKIAGQNGVGFQQPEIDTSNISQWATKIHTSLRQWHNNNQKLTLIRVPGTRRSRIEPSYYTLHPGIASQGIVIYDE